MYLIQAYIYGNFIVTHLNHIERLFNALKSKTSGEDEWRSQTTPKNPPPQGNQSWSISQCIEPQQAKKKNTSTAAGEVNEVEEEEAENNQVKISLPKRETKERESNKEQQRYSCVTCVSLGVSIKSSSFILSLSLSLSLLVSFVSCCWIQSHSFLLFLFEEKYMNKKKIRFVLRERYSPFSVLSP